MQIKYIPQGVCSREMTIDIEEGRVVNYKVVGGCPGNSLGINALIKGMTVDEAIKRLDGIKCGNKNTSCPDQAAQALKKYNKIKA